MDCQRAVVFLALLCAVASAANQDPPQNGDSDHHEHFPVPFEDAKTSDLAQDLLDQDLNDPTTLAEIEVRKFYRPPIFHPYFFPLLHQPHPSPETPETEEVTNTEEDSSEDDEMLIPEEAQPYDSVTDLDNDEIDQTEEQEAETTTDEAVPLNEAEARMERKSYEVPCDYLTMPSYSCYSCYTYLVCKADGGKVKSCGERGAPFCVNGVCSPIPSDECADNSTTLFN